MSIWRTFRRFLAQPSGLSSGNASSTFNGAGFAGFEIQKSGWSGSGEFFYASLSGDNTNPKVKLGMDIMYGQAMAGCIRFGKAVEPGGRGKAHVGSRLLPVSAIDRKSTGNPVFGILSWA